jgi:hypothetical protein
VDLSSAVISRLVEVALDENRVQLPHIARFAFLFEQDDESLD